MTRRDPQSYVAEKMQAYESRTRFGAAIAIMFALLVLIAIVCLVPTGPTGLKLTTDTFVSEVCTDSGQRLRLSGTVTEYVDRRGRVTQVYGRETPVPSWIGTCLPSPRR